MISDIGSENKDCIISHVSAAVAPSPARVGHKPDRRDVGGTSGQKGPKKGRFD